MAGPSNIGAAEASEGSAWLVVLAAAEAVPAGSQLLMHETGILFLIKSYDHSLRFGVVAPQFHTVMTYNIPISSTFHSASLVSSSLISNDIF